MARCAETRSQKARAMAWSPASSQENRERISAERHAGQCVQMERATRPTACPPRDPLLLNVDPSPCSVAHSRPKRLTIGSPSHAGPRAAIGRQPAWLLAIVGGRRRGSWPVAWPPEPEVVGSIPTGRIRVCGTSRRTACPSSALTDRPIRQVAPSLDIAPCGWEHRSSQGGVMSGELRFVSLGQVEAAVRAAVDSVCARPCSWTQPKGAPNA